MEGKSRTRGPPVNALLEKSSGLELSSRVDEIAIAMESTLRKNAII